MSKKYKINLYVGQVGYVCDEILPDEPKAKAFVEKLFKKPIWFVDRQNGAITCFQPSSITRVDLIPVGGGE